MNPQLRAVVHKQRSRAVPRTPATLFPAVALVSALALFTIGGFGMLITTLAYVSGVLGTPASRALAAEVGGGGARIYDRNGELLYQVFDPNEGYRTTVSLEEVSPYLLQATLAVEDPTFYENPGVDLRGIARAAWQNLRHGDIVQGGSSITQQLVKNVLLPQDQRNDLTLDRKAREAIMALELTQRYSKDQLLTLYLNAIYYGNFSYGVEAAAEGYFGKHAKDLDLAESAMLAGIPQRPALFSPLLNQKAATQRQHDVLDLMVRHGMLTQAEADTAKQQELAYQPKEHALQAPHFVMYVRDLLEQRYGTQAVLEQGLRVTTSLDMNLQRLGEAAVQDQVAKTDRSINAHNASLVSINPHTGEILAMVGSANYADQGIQGQVNMATAERQPGSSFKPFTYVTAFMKGWNPATMIDDAPLEIRDGINPPYRPQNVDKTFHGMVSIRTALSNSMNIPAIKTIQYTGVEAVLQTAHKLGITSLTRQGWYGLALTLGGGEVKLLDMTYAYAVFANGGRMAGDPVPLDQQTTGMRTLDPVAILKVEDASGKLLDQFTAPQTAEVLPAGYAYLITSILSDNDARRPIFGNSLQLPGPRPAAVKTGTTEDLRDFWTIGYTPDLVTGVWMGNADNKALSGGFSRSTTGPIWERFMTEALAGTPVTPFTRPADVVQLRVCNASGMQATGGCPSHTEVFVKGAEPKKHDPSQWMDVCGDGVLRPRPSTPPSATPGAAQPTPEPVACPPGSPGAGPPAGSVTVPNVVGKPEAEAKALLAAAHTPVSPWTNYQGSAQLPGALLQAVCVGCVLSTTPSPGTPVAPGTQVNIAVRRE